MKTNYRCSPRANTLVVETANAQATSSATDQATSTAAEQTAEQATEATAKGAVKLPKIKLTSRKRSAFARQLLPKFSCKEAGQFVSGDIRQYATLRHQLYDEDNYRPGHKNYSPEMLVHLACHYQQQGRLAGGENN